MITPDQATLLVEISALTGRLDVAARGIVAGQRAALDDRARWMGRLSPAHTIQNARQRLDDITARLTTRLSHSLDRRRDRLAAQARALEAANPRALLQRGYAMVTRAGDGQRITQTMDAAEGTNIVIQLHDGRLTATVRQRDFEHTNGEL